MEIKIGENGLEQGICRGRMGILNSENNGTGGMGVGFKEDSPESLVVGKEGEMMFRKDDPVMRINGRMKTMLGKCKRWRWDQKRGKKKQ